MLNVFFLWQFRINYSFAIMTRLRLIAFVFSILFVSALNAQKPAYQTGRHMPPEEARHKRNYWSFLYGSTEDEVLVADRTKTGVVVTSYDAHTLKRGDEFTLDNPKIADRTPDYSERFFDLDQVTTFYGRYSPKDDKYQLFGKVTNRGNKALVKDKLVVTINSDKRKNVGSVGVIRSKDHSKFLIYRISPDKKDADEAVDLWLYDDQLDKIYKKKLKFPYQSRQFNINEYLLTDSGSVFIIAEFFPTKAESKDGKNSSFKIFGINSNAEELEEIKVASKGQVFSSANGWLTDSGRSIAFTGFYRDDKKNKGANGLFYVKINAIDWKKEIVSFSKIEEDDMAKILLGAGTSERAKKRAQKNVDKGWGLASYQLKNILYDESGKFRIITQLEYYVIRCTRDSKGNETCHTYYYNDQIVEFDMDDEGKIVKTIVVPKMQLTVDWNAALGHIYLATPKRVYYIFNDNDRNLDPKKVEKQKGNNFAYTFVGTKKSRLVYAYQSDKKETIIKKPMTDSYKINFMIYPNRGVVRNNDGSAIVWAKPSKGKEMVLMRLYLKE
jgi:hypothetical protein